MNDFMTLLTDIICYPLGAIMKVFYFVTPNYALLLILFTIVVRLALFPLAIKQQRSSAEMLRMKPKMDALQKKYAKNQQKLQEETQKIYAEEGYNPMGGCMPLLIQMPILFALYQVVYNPLKYLMWYSQDTVNKIANTLRPVLYAQGHTDFNDLKIQLYIAKAMKDHPESLGFLGNVQTVDFNIGPVDLSATPVWGSILILIPIFIYVSQALSSFLSFKMNSQVQASQKGAKTQTLIMTFLMPIMSVWFSFSFPASVGFYWIVNSLLMVVQVLVLSKFWPLEKLAKQSEVLAEKRKEEIRTGKRKKSKMQLMTERALEMQQQTDKELAAKKNAVANRSPQGANKPANTASAEKPPVKLNSKGKKSRSQIKEEQRRRLAQARNNHKDM